MWPIIWLASTKRVNPLFKQFEKSLPMTRMYDDTIFGCLETVLEMLKLNIFGLIKEYK